MTHRRQPESREEMRALVGEWHREQARRHQAQQQGSFAVVFLERERHAGYAVSAVYAVYAESLPDTRGPGPYTPPRQLSGFA